jgi:G:T/U-mismatch repair DNA glycosylase
MLVIQVLPSSSPANATITLEKKCERWRVILDYLPCSFSREYQL